MQRGRKKKSPRFCRWLCDFYDLSKRMLINFLIHAPLRENELHEELFAYYLSIFYLINTKLRSVHSAFSFHRNVHTQRKGYAIFYNEWIRNFYFMYSLDH